MIVWVYNLEIFFFGGAFIILHIKFVTGLLKSISLVCHNHFSPFTRWTSSYITENISPFLLKERNELKDNCEHTNEI